MYFISRILRPIGTAFKRVFFRPGFCILLARRLQVCFSVRICRPIGAAFKRVFHPSKHPYIECHPEIKAAIKFGCNQKQPNLIA